MGSECNPSRSYYDLKMSKRTRKPWSSDRINHERSLTIASAESSERFITYMLSEEYDSDCFNGEGEMKEEVNLHDGDHDEILEEMKSEESNLPADTAEEEKKLQIVTVQHGGNKEGANLGKLLSRYMKAFAHMVRLKKGHRLASSRKKKVLQLPM